jgi:phosphatidylinositol glycan class N
VFSVLYVAAAPWPAFYGTQFLRENKSLAATWMAACVVMSGFTLLPAMKVEDLTLMYVPSIRHWSAQLTGSSMSGGALMVIIGVLYLIFEKRLLAQSGFPEDSTEPARDVLSRALIGTQVSYRYENIGTFLTRSRLDSSFSPC